MGRELPFEDEAVGGDADVVWEAGFEVCVGEFVAEVGEPDFGGVAGGGGGHGFGGVEVGGVRGEAEAVDDEDVAALHELHGGIRDFLAVGDVGDAGSVVWVEEEAAGIDLAVEDGEGGDGGAAEAEGAVDFAWVWFEIAGVAVVAVEGEVEDTPEVVHGGVGGVDGEGFVRAEGEAAEFVEAHDVVGVGVGDEGGVEVADTGAEALLAEVRAGVDEPLGVAVIDEEGAAEPLVARVGGEADWAIAGDHGDASGGAGAEEREREHGLGEQTREAGRCRWIFCGVRRGEAAA